jgi:hypothetical protein
MEKSNLNPLLKKLEKKNFIFQGMPRAPNRQKKSGKIKKREGDYKEFPYYLKKDLTILESIIKELVVTNQNYNIGFPYPKIRASNYIRSMRGAFDEDFNKTICYIFKDSNTIGAKACEIEPNLIKIDETKELHLLSFKKELPPIKERIVSKKLLNELEIWSLRYELDKCLREEPFNIEDFSKIKDELPEGYVLGNDIIANLYEAVNKLPNHEELPIWSYLVEVRKSLDELNIQERHA